MTLVSIEAAIVEGGFHAIACLSAEQAQRHLEYPQQPIAGLITHVRLKGGKISGWGLALRARELFPMISVIYISGVSGSDWRTRGVPDSIFIQKPFADAQLVTAMSTLLNVKRGGLHAAHRSGAPSGTVHQFPLRDRGMNRSLV